MATATTIEKPVTPHQCNMECYVDKFGKDHHAGKYAVKVISTDRLNGALVTFLDGTRSTDDLQRATDARDMQRAVHGDQFYDYEVITL